MTWYRAACRSCEWAAMWPALPFLARVSGQHERTSGHTVQVSDGPTTLVPREMWSATA